MRAAGALTRPVRSGTGVGHHGLSGRNLRPCGRPRNRHRTRVERNAVIGRGTFIDHDSRIGEAARIARKCRLGYGVRVGKRAQVGDEAIMLGCASA